MDGSRSSYGIVQPALWRFYALTEALSDWPNPLLSCILRHQIPPQNEIASSRNPIDPTRVKSKPGGAAPNLVQGMRSREPWLLVKVLLPLPMDDRVPRHGIEWPAQLMEGLNYQVITKYSIRACIVNVSWRCSIEYVVKCDVNTNAHNIYIYIYIPQHYYATAGRGLLYKKRGERKGPGGGLGSLTNIGNKHWSFAVSMQNEMWGILSLSLISTVLLVPIEFPPNPEDGEFWLPSDVFREIESCDDAEDDSPTKSSSSSAHGEAAAADEISAQDPLGHVVGLNGPEGETGTSSKNSEVLFDCCVPLSVYRSSRSKSRRIRLYEKSWRDLIIINKFFSNFSMEKKLMSKSW